MAANAGTVQSVRGARFIRLLGRRAPEPDAFAPPDESRVAFYRQFVAPGDLCFDIGANVGDRTALFRAAGARVIAVEPQEACVEVLRRRFAADPDVVVVASAVGREPGTAELRVADVSTISSMSDAWIGAVRESGRFCDFDWSRTVTVPVITLDALIAEHGVPAFVKIDVEGYEEAVIAGLGRPVAALAFEFTPELLDVADRCVAALEQGGFDRFAFSEGESLQLDEPGWTDAATLRARLAEAPQDAVFFGDVYAAAWAPARAAANAGS